MRRWKTSKAGNKQRGRVLFKHFLESFAVKTQQKTITPRDNAKKGCNYCSYKQPRQEGDSKGPSTFDLRKTSAILKMDSGDHSAH